MMWDGIPSARGTDIPNTELRTEFIISLNAQVVPLQGGKREEGEMRRDAECDHTNVLFNC